MMDGYIGKALVNGQNYEFVLKNEKFFVLRNKDGNISLLNLKLASNMDKELILETAIDNIIKASKKAIETKIKEGFYKNTDEIKEDLVTCISRINIPELAKLLENKEITDNKSVKKAINDLTLSFLKQNENTLEKKEIIEENIDVNLDTLFKEHGITEYSISDDNNVVVYYKDGILHTINNTNPNESIYDSILSQIDLDKITSKEEIDKQIDNIMDLNADYKYSKNRNVDTPNLDKDALNVAENLEDSYGNIKLSGQVLAEPFLDKSLILADLDGTMKPVFIDENGEVIIGAEKNIDNDKNVETSIKNEEIKDLEDDLRKENVKDKTRDILIKCYQEEDLTDEEIDFANFYREDAIFDSLDVEVRIWMLQIHDYIDALNNEYEIEKEEEKVKKIEMPKFQDEEAKELTTFVTILSIIMGSIMILTIGILI